MPTFTGRTEDNIPIDFDLSVKGEVFDINVSGTAIFLSCDDARIDALITLNQRAYDDCIEDYKRDRREYDQWMARMVRDGQK